MKELFKEWLQKVGMSKTCIENYPASIVALSMEMEEPNTNRWPGIFEYLIGTKPDKGPFDVSDLDEFYCVYGRFLLMIDAKEPDSWSFDREKYDKCFWYTHKNEPGTDHRRLSNALRVYRKFLTWNDLKDHGLEYPIVHSAVDDRLGPRQRIYYGAPGTGKSKGVNDTASKLPKENVIRTTFHPDSDYSTFVGAYKPTMVREIEEQKNKHLGIDQLADILKKEYDAAGEGSDKGKALAVDLFAEQYHEYLDGRFGKVSLADLLSKVGMPKGYNVGLRDSINVAKYHILEKAGKKHISYEFVPQAFAKAYVQAWKKMANPEADGKVSPVMLVVEEINRGDCAKIFGDLFQLLDRLEKDDKNDPKKKAGFSEYPVLADSDLADYIRRELDAVKDAAVFKDYPFVIAAENLELLLPPNMYIWVTMNTSDQSLFPMDSAFKRRWDWKYVPIKNHPEENWKIVIGMEEYSWWDFLKKINKEVRLLTSSEDKQLGYFFVKTPDQTVREDAFVNKVLFFLWNVVWKDCYTECEYLKNGDDYFTFRDFFDDDGKANAGNVNKVLEELKVEKWKADAPAATASAPTTGAANAAAGGETSAAQ